MKRRSSPPLATAGSCERQNVRLFIKDFIFILLLATLFTACVPEATQPDYFETAELTGSPYERGFQHGQRFSSKIRSLYTTLLENSIYPYLNRDRWDVASVMLIYQDEEIYGNGKFSKQMMLECGRDYEKFIPQEYIEEMHGIADGADFPYEKVLLLNTFFDTLMGFRSITFFIKLAQGPHLLNLAFTELDTDGMDNDSDGEIDEVGEGDQDPYEPRSYATMVEVPTDAQVKFIIDDEKEGVNPESVRIQFNEKVYDASDPSIKVEPYAREGKTVLVTFTPPDGWPEASSVSLIVQCTDLLEHVRVPPDHPRSMRDERITFTTIGYGAKTWEVANRGVDDGRTQPPSYTFAVKGEATRDGHTYMAHQFAMLDSNTTHKHTALFIHHPDNGQSFAVLGYAGVVWGLSGMNESGLAFSFNASDTLNTPFLDSFNEGLIFARFEPTGVPMGIMGRELLSKRNNVEESLPYFDNNQATFGWNVMMADASGDMKVIELDSDISFRPEGGVYIYGADPDDPENQNIHGESFGSDTPYDLRTASHYQKDLNEVGYSILNFNLVPQRYWSTFYFRSVRAFFNVGATIKQHFGKLDKDSIIAILRQKELVDSRDSMNSAIYDTQRRKIYAAAGQVPSSDGEFVEVDLGGSSESGGDQ